jgi:rubrerythrin
LSCKGGSETEGSDVTASAIISFAEKLETESSRFYKALADKSTENYREAFLLFAEEGERNKKLLTRTYQETITDALEACFSFKGMNLNDYAVQTALTEKTSFLDALKMAIELEHRAAKFYLDVAERSRSLLATIPYAFRKVARKRNDRKIKLKSLHKSRLMTR